MLSVALKNYNSAYLYVVIISPDPYFTSFFGLYLSNHLEYCCRNIQQVTQSVTCKNDNWACPHFLIISPDQYFTSFLAYISVTYWNILILLCRLIQQVCAECCMQE